MQLDDLLCRRYALLPLIMVLMDIYLPISAIDRHSPMGHRTDNEYKGRRGRVLSVQHNTLPAKSKNTPLSWDSDWYGAPPQGVCGVPV